MAHMAVCGCRMSDVGCRGERARNRLRHPNITSRVSLSGERPKGGSEARLRSSDHHLIIIIRSLDLYIATPSLINHNVTSIHCLAIILSKSGNTVPIPLTTMTLDLPSESRYQPPPTDSRDRSITTRDLMEGDGRIHNSLAFALRGSIASKLRTP
jgi:hypothetical protein